MVPSCNSNGEDENPFGLFMVALIDDVGAFNVTFEDFYITTFDLRIRQSQNGAYLDFFARMDGVNSGYSEIGGKIYNYSGVGTYKTGENIDDKDLLFFYDKRVTYYSNDNTSIEENTFEEGTLTITKDDGEFVEGTFNFICFANEGTLSKQINNGSFKLKYP